jgi:protein phosphatase
MSLRGKLEFAGLSDVGLKRDHNEDSIGSDPDIGLAVLADGMGGYKAGEVASAIAVNVIMEQVQKAVQNQPPEVLDEESGYCMGTLMLRDAITAANGIIQQTAQNQPQCQGMGTTLAAVLFYDNRCSIAHVGDSRIYRLRDGRLEQLTVDHSLLQELIDKGFYTPEEAKNSVQKNLVTRALGVEESVRSELQEEPVAVEDLFLLCSDGLSDMVDEEQIHLIIEQHSANLEQIADSLIQAANRNGGNDNVSVLLVKTVRPFPAGSAGTWYSKVINWFS